MPRKTLPANVVGPKIREFRKKLGFTQDAFATQCQLAGLDISRSTLGQIESRLRFVSDSELIVIASLLGVATEQLFPPDVTRKLRGKKLRSISKK
jgi:transcriptional regulator with XRE-family HTH domain